MRQADLVLLVFGQSPKPSTEKNNLLRQKTTIFPAKVGGRA